MIQYLYAFLLGGTLTAGIVFCQINGFPLLSRMAALFPVFTWASYLFIGLMGNAKYIANHTLFVLLGTLCAWVPYMLFIYFFVQRWGPVKALGGAIFVFVCLAFVFSLLYRLPT